MLATIQTKAIHDSDIDCFSGYVEISERDYNGILKAFGMMLFCFQVGESRFSRAYMLAATKSAFLIETTDNRFFVTAEAVN